MNTVKSIKVATALVAALAVSGCGGQKVGLKALSTSASSTASAEPERKTIWDALKKQDTGNQVSVNKYLWSASIETLNFLPIQTVDPFTGVIVTGYGTPPNGGRAYRATVLIDDPALDARSLTVALQSRSGPVSAATTRAIEDAILSRARQLRIADKNY